MPNTAKINKGALQEVRAQSEVKLYLVADARTTPREGWYTRDGKNSVVSLQQRIYSLHVVTFAHLGGGGVESDDSTLPETVSDT